MQLNLLRWRSLKTRLTFLTLAIFLFSIWSLALYASRMLREDMQHQLGEQQFASVSLVAANVNDELNERLKALENVAGIMRTEAFGNATAAQSFLEQQPIFQSIFNGGIFATRMDGLAFAQVVPAGAPGNTYVRDTGTVASALQGQPTIGRPFVSQAMPDPVLLMAVPIRDTQGQVTGALSGVVNLRRSNFLERIALSSYGKSGGYMVIAPQHQLFVTATDKSRVMQPTPAPGANTMHDRYMQGFEGYGIARNSLGVEELSAAKGIAAAGWFVVAALPTAEAFAPIDAIQQHLMLAAAALTLLAGGLIWWTTTWMLQKQLSPLLAASRSLALADPTQAPQPPLPARQDEIGQLIGGFQSLLDTSAQRESLHQQIINTASVAIFLVDMQGRITQANQPMADMFGCTHSALEGADYVSLVHPEEREEGRKKMLALLASQIQSVDLDRLYWRADHTRFWGRLTGRRFVDAQGKDRGLVGVIANISDRKQVQNYEKFRSRILEMLAASAPLSAVLEAIVLGVEQVRCESLCSIQLLDGEGRHFCKGVAPSLPDFYNDALTGLAIGAGMGSCGAAAFTGERVVVEDIATHPDWAPFKDLAARADLGACWSQPIRSSKGKVLGTFAIYHRTTARTPQASDIAVIEQSASLASIAIEKSTDAQKLRDSEERYRTLVEWSPDPVLVHRLGEILYVNAAAIKMFGAKDASGLVGQWTRQLIHPDFLEAQTARMKAINDKVAIPPMVESKFLRLDGGAIDVEVQGTAITYDGEPAIHVSIRDITARKLAESRLQLAASVFTHAQEGIFITTLDGAIIDVNAAFSRITGFGRGDVLGRNPHIFSSGRHDRHFYQALFAELAENGQWHGEIWNRRKNGEVYAQMLTISTVNDVNGRAQYYASLFSDITAMKEHQRQLEHIAHFDALTSLPNRVLLADRLHQGMAQAQRRGQPLAVAFLDLDGFKAVNDKHGHDAGDQLLIALAARMKQALRDGDTLARMGGDEFVAVLVDLPDIAASVPLLTRLLIAAAEPVQVGPFELQVSASLGVTFYPQAQEVDADQLLRQADQAMYQAKLAGKNRYHVFDAAHDHSVRGHHESLEHIRQALVEQEFVLFYQPKVNMRTGAVIGAEALIRWQHPERGLLPPAAFLPVIEDHPLAIAIGEWVIDTALTQMEHWASAGLDMEVSVNIGARQLQQVNFVERLQGILARHPHAKPGGLSLEVLETSALEDVGGVSHAIEACRRMGVRFALDDFGTGYSSLTYLKRLPVALLKVDQSFVRDMLDDPDDLAILEGVIGLASAFRRDVIAEGVETIAHGTMLLQLGCDLAQGYGIARPMPARQLPLWKAHWRPDPAWCHMAPVRREDFPMLFAGVEHRAWSKSMEDFLHGLREAPPELDHLQCHLGQWLSKEGRARHGAHPALAAIDTLHQQAHALAATLCGLYGEGQPREALERLPELLTLRDQLLEQLKSLLPA